MLETPYYVPSLYRNRDDSTASFGIFRYYLQSLEHRNRRLELRRFSLHADLLKNRCTGLPIEFRHLLQADLVVFLRNRELDNRWWPETLLYARRESPSEVFARSKSRAYFQQVLAMLGYPSKEQLVQQVEYLADNGRMPKWSYETIDIRPLMALKDLATLP